MYLLFINQSTILFYEVFNKFKLAICKNKKKCPQKMRFFTINVKLIICVNSIFSKKQKKIHCMHFT